MNNELYLLMRVSHIVLGAVWVGAIFLAAFFLMPAVAEAGPDGAKVMAGIIRRKYMTLVPIIAGVTVLSGLLLYWKYTAGFDPAISRSPGAMVFGAGGIIAILAYGLGVHVMRGNMIKAGALTAKAGGLPDGAEKAALMAEAMARRKTAMRVGPIVAVMLLVTAALMALGHRV
jgi:uncharacterized membrane protein